MFSFVDLFVLFVFSCFRCLFCLFLPVCFLVLCFCLFVCFCCCRLCVCVFCFHHHRPVFCFCSLRLLLLFFRCTCFLLLLFWGGGRFKSKGSAAGSDIALRCARCRCLGDELLLTIQFDNNYRWHEDCHKVRPDITAMVDWALKINYLSIYLPQSSRKLFASS